MAQVDDKRKLKKEIIRSRMIKSAADLWGHHEAEIEDFDPLVGMLMGALAVELESVNSEIISSQARVLERLAQLLTPEAYTCAQPAHAILHARSVEPEYIIRPDAQLYYPKKIRAKDAASRDTTVDIYFSPIAGFKLFRGDVKYLASGKLIQADKDVLQKEVIATSDFDKSLPASCLYIGIELDREVTSLEGMSFFFDWANNPDEDFYYSLLPLAKWKIGKHTLNTKAGIEPVGYADDQRAARLKILEEFDITNRVIEQVNHFYHPHYATIEAFSGSDEKLNIGSLRGELPDEFKKVFSEKDLEGLDSDVVWIEVQLPHSIPTSALGDVICQINSIPVINRRLNRFSHRLQQNLNIVPLHSDENFFAVKSVVSSEGTVYMPVPLTHEKYGSLDTYTLRYGGVGRFDSRDAKEMVNYLISLLEDESASFSALNHDFLSSHINDLNQIIARLEQNVKQNSLTMGGSVHYLLLRPKVVGETAHVEFWSTTGELGNAIPAGRKLELYEGSDLDKNSLILVTKTVGGREKLSESESIYAYKKAIMTRGRAVTAEDIKAFCFADLGHAISDVRVSRGIIINNKPKVGFVRTIDVYLTPSKMRESEVLDWKETCKDLKVLLETYSTQTCPFRVMMEKN